MSSKEYIIVHQIDKETPLMRSIPLHMTAVHWFTLEETNEDRLMSDFTGFTERQDPVTVRAMSEDMFGPDKDIPVVKLERTREIAGLHLGLLAVVQGSGAVLDRRWAGESNWNPHVTHKSGKRLSLGDNVEIGDLDIITRQPSGVRKLLRRVYMRGERICDR